MRWLPVHVGVFLCLLVGGIWFALDRQRDADAFRLVEAKAAELASFIAGDIRARVPSLQRIARRWESRGGTPRGEFVRDAAAYVQDLPGFQALEWVDENFHVRWIVPLRGNERAQNLDLAFEDRRRVALEAARDLGVPTMTRPIDLVQGGKGFLIHIPIVVGDTFNGFILAVFRTEHWLNYVFDLRQPANTNKRFAASVKIDGEQIYTQRNWREDRQAGWRATTHTQILGHEIAVSVQPTAYFFDVERSLIPETVAAGGVLFSGLIAILVYLLRQASLATANSRAANRSLEDALEGRLRAEEELQRSHDELEQRVAERTEELRESEERLHQAQKMEAVGQLTGGVAHDFNNLLAVILGNAELLTDDAVRADPRLQSILGATQRGAELTQRMLAFARQQPLRPRPVELGRLVNGMSDLLVRSLGETIEIKTAAADGLWTALADHSQVENALLNLAINARDAMPDGGNLTIECTNTHLDQDYIDSNPESTVGDYVMLAVSDNGVGMSTDVQAHAFDPFFTTKDVGHGSGLGLSMIYGFARQSGGHVKIYSEMGHGTTVKLYLPRSEAPAAAAEVEEPPEIQKGKGERILVVEDDTRVRDLAVKMLKGLGYRVTGAADAASGRAVLKQGDKIDLVLSDIVLPGGVSGPDFAKELLRQHPAMRVVFMSGYPADAATRNGFVDSDKILLNKPFRRHRLADALRAAFDQA